MGLRDADGRFDKNDSQPTTVMTTEISSSSKGFVAYLAVTAAYWSFMLTDGALRMLVLLHFHTLGFSPIQLGMIQFPSLSHNAPAPAFPLLHFDLLRNN